MKHAETEITAAEQQAWQAGLEAGREQGRRAPCVDDHQISDVTRQLIKRDQAGRKKYGTSLDRTDLTLADWLQHMAEELLDAAGYALAAKRTALAQQPPAEAQPVAWPDGLLDRVKEAERRIENGYAPRRIPADPNDVDLVLAEVRALLEGCDPPFWIKPPSAPVADYPHCTNGYFSFDEPNGFERHDTLEAAEAAATKTLEECREAAWSDKEWPQDVEWICYGRLIGTVRESVFGPEDRYTDYYLDHVFQAAPVGVEGGAGTGGGVVLPRYFLDFLLGQGQLEGFWFGDKPATEKGQFWWRSRLRALAAQQGGSDNDR